MESYAYHGPLFSLEYHGVGRSEVPTVSVASGGLSCEALSDYLADLGTPLSRWEEYLGEPWVYIEEAERLVQAMRSLRVMCGHRPDERLLRERAALARRLRYEHGLSAKEIEERTGFSSTTCLAATPVKCVEG